MLTVNEALALITQQAKSMGTEFVSIADAQGRILAEDIAADRDYPPFNRAAMDGYAIRADDFLENGITEFKIAEDIFAGSLPAKKIDQGDCYKIMTGASTPPAADTIIRVEDATQTGSRVVFTIDKIKKGQNIARQGEDRKKDELVLKKNTLLTAREVAVLAVLGKKNILVQKLPAVSIISTGDEVISIDKAVLPHQIRDSNSYALEGFLKHYQIKIQSKKLVSDDKELLRQAIEENRNSDILIISGGVSMGDADYVPDVLRSLGIEKIFHKVAIKPGKPLWFGKSKTGVVFALPGNPMSVQVAYKIFIEPYLRNCFGLPALRCLRIPMATSRIKKTTFDDYFSCTLEGEDSLVLKPVVYKGSGDVTAVLYSDGLALHESEQEDLKEGDKVRFIFWENNFTNYLI